MLRLHMLVVPAVLAALTLAATADAVTPPRVIGTVGPGFTITLKRFNKPFRTLKAGRYTFVVSDKSSIHNWHLKGPVNREITTVGFVGTKTVILTLKKGRYTFVCDPHFTSMKGSFTVT